MLNGQNEAAIEGFQKCLLSDPKDAAVHYALYQVYLKTEHYTEAVSHTKAAASLDPSNRQYQRELAFMYQQTGQTKLAAETFEKLLKEEPKNVDYYSGALAAYTDLKAAKKAVNLLGRMEEALGSNPGIAIERFKLYSQLNQDKEAEAALQVARKQFPNEASIIANLVDFYFKKDRFSEGFAMLKELVAADPQNGMALLMYGEMLYRSGNVQEGMRYLKQGIQAEGPTIDQKMSVLIMMQNQASTDPDMEKLVQYMTKRYPSDAKAHSIAGDFYYKAGRLPEAISAYRETTKCDPNLYPVWNQLLVLEFEAQQWASLQIDAAQCVGVFPNQPLPHFLNGLVQNRLQQFKQAAADLELADGLVLNDNQLLAEINVQKGIALFGLQQESLAHLAFKEALSLSQSNPAVQLQYIHELLLRHIEEASANEWLEALLLQHPKTPLYLQEKAFAFFQQKKYAEAQSLVLLLEQTELTESVAYLELKGDILFKLGQMEPALEQWKLARSKGEGSIRLDEKIAKRTYIEIY
ncbi:MAG: hypothetical protein RLZZ301_909 [Bacteroidota bacterium]